jgi:hypothetical protein
LIEMFIVIVIAWSFFPFKRFFGWMGKLRSFGVCILYLFILF